MNHTDHGHRACNHKAKNNIFPLLKIDPSKHHHNDLKIVF